MKTTSSCYQGLCFSGRIWTTFPPKAHTRNSISYIIKLHKGYQELDFKHLKTISYLLCPFPEVGPPFLSAFCG